MEKQNSLEGRTLWKDVREAIEGVKDTFIPERSVQIYMNDSNNPRLNQMRKLGLYASGIGLSAIAIVDVLNATGTIDLAVDLAHKYF